MARLLNVNRSTSNESVINPLAKSAGPGNVTPFNTIRELLCFAAMLGFAKGERRPLVGEKEDIARSTFEENDSYDFVFLIGVAETNSLDILKDGNEAELNRIFEEYAQGGLDIIATWMTQYNDPKGFRAIVRGLCNDGFIQENELEEIDILGSLQF
jgi:dnd system-associated protein 4